MSPIEHGAYVVSLRSVVVYLLSTAFILPVILVACGAVRWLPAVLLVALIVAVAACVGAYADKVEQKGAQA